MNFPALNPVEGADRFPPTDPADWDDAMRAAAAALIATPRGEVRGPFVPLLRSPDLLDRTQKLGEFLRYRCGVEERLREFAICVIARLWSQPYEWRAHAPLAARAGVAQATLAALRDGRAAPDMPADERLILDFCTALDADRRIDDDLHTRTVAILGESGTIELVGLCGYYALLAMVMNVARTPYSGVAFEFPVDGSTGR
ncbi:carboxymuconolactone decarboxylase family protein [Sphingomonas sp.]|uniref:carboxymuconolactone decarboxylase family protein n=1 Tax=Sphingomonas sp. TaxID=28214 RepID=UPI0025F06588|nr:carboxymuconolactone decarboxylase family protein [Sphingomonas sp.]